MKKLLNILIIIGYAFFAAALLYQQLPIEYQEKISFINKDYFLFSGISTGGIATVIHYIKNVLNKNTEFNLNSTLKFNDVLKQQGLKLEEQKINIDTLSQIVEALRSVKQDENVKQDEIIKLLNENNEYARLELKSRLTNPLLDKEIAKEIEEVLDNEKKDNIQSP